MTKILIFIIKIYQYLISPMLGSRCRFLPTCSEYFIEALKTQGLTMGIRLGIKRILKCHPIKKLGGSHGLDFVPIPKDKKESKNDRNVFVAIALSMSVLLFWGAFFETPKKTSEQQINQKVEQKSEQGSITPTINQPQIIKKLPEKSSLIRVKELKLKMIV